MITEKVKQDSVFLSALLCATTAQVIGVGGKLNCKYGDIVLRMSIYMGNILVAGKPHEMKESNKTSGKI